MNQQQKYKLDKMSTNRNNTRQNAGMNTRLNKGMNKRLNTGRNNTLIIIDWDDTLYPTTWTLENSINLAMPQTRYKYAKYFEYLDDKLSEMLQYLTTLGDVVIITNAMIEWIDLTTSMLPKTKKVLRNIEVISARSRYQNKVQMPEWKKHTFLEEYIKRSRSKHYTNILSLGDAEFEYNALVNLHKHNVTQNNQGKYLKSIKFIKSSNYNELIEQLHMIKTNISVICSMPRHMDLVFDQRLSSTPSISGKV